MREGEREREGQMKRRLQRGRIAERGCDTDHHSHLQGKG